MEFSYVFQKGHISRNSIRTWHKEFLDSGLVIISKEAAGHTEVKRTLNQVAEPSNAALPSQHELLSRILV
jgi:hypothetical protein